MATRNPKTGLGSMALNMRKVQKTAQRYQAQQIQAEAVDPEIIDALNCIGTAARLLAKYLPRKSA